MERPIDPLSRTRFFVENFDKALLNLFSLYNTVGLHPSLGEKINGTFLSYVRGVDSAWPNTFYPHRDISNETADLFEGISLDRFSKFNPLLITKTEMQLGKQLRRMYFMPLEQWKGMWREIGPNEDFNIKNGPIELSTVQTGGDLTEWLTIVSSNLFSKRLLKRELFQYFLDSCAELVLLKMNGETIGASMVYFDGTDTPGIYMVCINEQQRGRGFGQLLMNFTLDLIRKDGYEQCVLQSTNSGLNLYKRMKFLDTGSYDLYIKIK